MKKYEESDKNINIFGFEFVYNNKDKCKMIIDNKEYEIEARYNIGKYNNNKLKIKLKVVNNVTNISNIFKECSSLSSLPYISKQNTNNVTDMFSGFSSLTSIPDISKWNTNNVTDMS